MRILSTRLFLSSGFRVEDFYTVLIKWLKDSSPCKPVGELFEIASDKENNKSEAGYCVVETFTAQRDDVKHYLFKLTHIFHEQTWQTEVIYSDSSAEKIVTIHIDCSGDTVRFNETPLIRSEVIRCFVNSGMVISEELPITSKPIYLTSEKVEWLSEIINGRYQGDLPLLFVSKIFNTSGYEVDIEKISKTLSGLAYVLVEADDNFVGALNEYTSGHNPYNGHIGIYYPGEGLSNTYSRANVARGNSLDKMIVEAIAKYVTAMADKTNLTWDALYNEQIAKQAQENQELLDEAIDENGSLEEQLRQAKERIHRLVQENSSLRSQKEVLQNSLREQTDGRLLESADIVEYFDGEQFDFVITVLNKARKNYNEGTRAYAVLSALLDKNVLIGNGKKIEQVVKSVLSKAENLRDRDFAELREVGFEVVSDNTHYKLIYRGDPRYTFSVAKTASDKQRSGKNLVSDICKKISVYS